MIDPYGAYSFSLSGIWPFETYIVEPLRFNANKGKEFKNLPIRVPAVLRFRYKKQADILFNGINLQYNIPIFNVINGIYSYDEQFGEEDYLLKSSSSEKTTLNWTPSNIRVYNSGEIFNYFVYKPLDNDIQYSYALYPSKLILIPTSIVKNQNGTYSVTTETRLLSSHIFYLSSNNLDTEQNTFLQNYVYENGYPNPSFLYENVSRKNIPLTYQTIPNGDIIYTLSSFKSVSFKELVSFDENKPFVFSLKQFLESNFITNNIKIRPDSVSLTYCSTYDVDGLEVTIGHLPVEFLPHIAKDLESSYILNFNIQNNISKTDFEEVTTKGYFSKIFSFTDTTLQNLVTSISSIDWSSELVWNAANSDISLYKSYSSTLVSNDTFYRSITSYSSLYETYTVDITAYQIDRSFKDIRNIQTYQFVQSALDDTKLFRDVDNCIQKLSLNLKTGLFEYQADTYTDDNNVAVGRVRPEPSIPITINYIVDSDVFLNTNSTIQYNNNSVNSTSNISKTWTLNHPPHNYTFNATYSTYNDTNKTFIGDTATLNFYLTSFIIDKFLSETQASPLVIDSEIEPKTIFFKSYSGFKINNSIISDYGFYELDLNTFASNDTISFKMIFQENDIFINALSCLYGPDFNNVYDLKTSPYVPITLAKELLILYPNETYGELRFNFISTLSTYNTQINCKKTINLLFSEGKSSNIKPQPISITKLDESENKIIVSCASISSTLEQPYKSLENTLITWFIEPSTVDVTIVPVDYYTYEPILSATTNNEVVIQTIKDKEIKFFNTDSSTILISGYGDSLITIYLSSLKFNEVASLNNDPFLFDFFKDNSFILKESPIENTGKTSIVSISSSVLYGNGEFKIPPYVNLYWYWTYNNNDDISIIPITAYRTNGQVYNRGDIVLAENGDILTFKINLDDGNNSFNVNQFKVSLISNYNDRIISGEKTLLLNDFPARNIFNTDFKINYINNQSVVQSFFEQNTRDDRYVLTRPKDDFNQFIFSSNIDVLPTISFENISWVISSNTGYFSISTYNTYENFSKNLIYKLPNDNTTQTNITLSASKATLANWLVPNNVSTTLKIYTLSNSEFTNPLNFLVYPPYTWIDNNNGNLTLLDNTNYTLAFAPTAYEQKKSNSQNFYVSSNKMFNEYEYYYGANKNFITTLCSISGQIEIPYHPKFLSDNGATVFLTAFNDYFPKNNGVIYTGLKQNNSIYTGFYPITSKTFNFKSIQQNNFVKNPKIIPYDNQKIIFTPKLTSIDLDSNDYISVTQSIVSESINKKVSVYYPNDSFAGINVYTLSCKYWKTSIEASSENGFYELFFLRIGDPSIPLNIKDNEITTIKLSVSSLIPVKIPKETFNNVLNTYSEDTDLWNTTLKVVTAEPLTLVAYSTSVEPEVFISSYYTITGKEFAIQLQTPENSFNYIITSYDIFFGDGTSQKIYDDQLFYKTYVNDGVYALSYNVYYNNGTSKYFKLNSPIIVYNNWPSYDQSKIRLLNEKILNFGIEDDTYSLDQIEIQPNEWGDSDIFNTALNRIQDNLNYLIYNSQTMNTDSPTLFYGWLGNNIDQKAYGIKWHTLTYNKQYVNSPQNAYSLKDENDDIKNLHSYFANLKDAVESKDVIYVIDDNKFRAFSGGKIPQEIFFENKLEMDTNVLNPVSIDVDETGRNVYISDSFKNKIFKFNIDVDSYPPQINQNLSIGNLGTREEVNKLNAPSQIFYINGYVFVLDYNNNCIKQYTKDLNWVFTYHIPEFDMENKKPISFAVNPSNLLIYVLTENYIIYIFDYFKSELFETIDVLQIKESFDLVKIFFDQSGDFFYILNEKNIYKFSTSGSFINQVSIQNPDNQITFKSGRFSDYRSITLVSEYGILKFQDVLNIFKIGEGLSRKYWTKDQINLSSDEFADDLTYNRALNRMAQNIKTFRDTLESKFVIVTEQTDIGVVEYFSLYPISHESRPIFSSKIENETLGVGVNEFHIPQVFNREIKELYNSLVELKDFLEIKDLRIANINNSSSDNCNQVFCWSWKAMSCYNLTLPIIKICNINPITYAELESSYPSDYIYAPNNKYGNAISRCCEDFKNPLTK